jgi:hypothetical protein
MSILAGARAAAPASSWRTDSVRPAAHSTVQRVDHCWTETKMCALGARQSYTSTAPLVDSSCLLAQRSVLNAIRCSCARVQSVELACWMHLRPAPTVTRRCCLRVAGQQRSPIPLWRNWALCCSSAPGVGTPLSGRRGYVRGAASACVPSAILCWTAVMPFAPVAGQQLPLSRVPPAQPTYLLAWAIALRVEWPSALPVAPLLGRTTRSARLAAWS